jgi:hypothetical protein
MWAVRHITRKAFAVFLAVVFVLAVQPVASATPAHHATMNHTMNCCDHGPTKSHHSMPQKGCDTPCKDMANCNGVQSCSATTAIQQPGVAYIAPIRLVARSWQTFNIRHGISVSPDNPPPIV